MVKRGDLLSRDVNTDNSYIEAESLVAVESLVESGMVRLTSEGNVCLAERTWRAIRAVSQADNKERRGVKSTCFWLPAIKGRMRLDDPLIGYFAFGGAVMIVQNDAGNPVSNLAVCNDGVLATITEQIQAAAVPDQVLTEKRISSRPKIFRDLGAKTMVAIMGSLTRAKLNDRHSRDMAKERDWLFGNLEDLAQAIKERSRSLPHVKGANQVISWSRLIDQADLAPSNSGQYDLPPFIRKDGQGSAQKWVFDLIGRLHHAGVDDRCIMEMIHNLLDAHETKRVADENIAQRVKAHRIRQQHNIDGTAFDEAQARKIAAQCFNDARRDFIDDALRQLLVCEINDTIRSFDAVDIGQLSLFAASSLGELRAMLERKGGDLNTIRQAASFLADIPAMVDTYAESENIYGEFYRQYGERLGIARPDHFAVQYTMM